ncbi:MAG: hypothetical protein ACTSWQ_10160 [Candidatus Thorarchaeota archaeon]
MISMSDLMQIEHPGYNVYSCGTDMEEEYYPLFMDYCVCVCKRFRHYAAQHNNTLVTENSLMQIIDFLKEIEDSDDPAIVLPLREKIRSSCYEFRTHCEDMGKCFQTPPSMFSFYKNMGEIVSTIACDFAGVEHT